MTAATAAGGEINETWEELISVMWALARWAIDSWAASGMILSCRPTTSQDGIDFHAGTPDSGSPNAISEVGLCVTASSAACAWGRSGAKLLNTTLGNR